MKIYSNAPLLNEHLTQKKTITKRPTEKEFGSVLKETLDRTKQTLAGTRPTNGVNSMPGVQPAFFSAPIDKQDTLGRVENLIDQLDQYRQMLADPRMTLKKIEPIIRNMAQEKENLVPVLDWLSDGEGLKSILNQTLITTSLEISKFYRGDYITP